MVIWGSLCVNYRHPYQRRVWKGGSAAQSLPHFRWIRWIRWIWWIRWRIPGSLIFWTPPMYFAHFLWNRVFRWSKTINSDIKLFNRLSYDARTLQKVRFPGGFARSWFHTLYNRFRINLRDHVFITSVRSAPEDVIKMRKMRVGVVENEHPLSCMLTMLRYAPDAPIGFPTPSKIQIWRAQIRKS